MVYDVSQSLTVVKDISESKETFLNIESLLVNSTAKAALLNMKKH